MRHHFYMNTLELNMNERIDEIARLAGCHTTSRHDPVLPAGNGWIINQETLDKFAEMIVRECMKQVKEQYQPVLEDEDMVKESLWDGYIQCGVDSYVAIREHFFGEDAPEECPTCGDEWSGTSCGVVDCGWLK